MIRNALESETQQVQQKVTTYVVSTQFIYILSVHLLFYLKAWQSTIASCQQSFSCSLSFIPHLSVHIFVFAHSDSLYPAGSPLSTPPSVSSEWLQSTGPWKMSLMWPCSPVSQVPQKGQAAWKAWVPWGNGIWLHPTTVFSEHTWPQGQKA